MVYEELVKRLRSLAEEQFFDYERKPYLQAADAIEKLATNYDAATDIMKHQTEYIEELEAKLPRWIPVTVEPPLKVGDDSYNGYLVYANGYYEVADYTADKFDNVPCFHVNGEYEPDVTHYMPLPEPPKEDT